MPETKGEISGESKLEAACRTGDKLCREAQMITLGVAAAAVETAEKPWSKLPELGLSLAAGTGLGMVSRLGAGGRWVAAGVGGCMMLKAAADELSAGRWSKFALALEDTWKSPQHMKQNILATKESLGSFLIDTGMGCAGIKLGSALAWHVAPPIKLATYCQSHSLRDGGHALRRLEDRFESPSTFSKAVRGKLDLLTFSQAAEVGAPRGDLLSVATTPDGEIVLAAMDVEGHGLKAARKAVSVHTNLQKILPQAGHKSASQVLTMLDGQLSSSDELAITAALAKYNPASHRLQTATASSQFAFLIRAGGRVRQLDARGGGLGLGTDMYSRFPHGEEAVRLMPGDTVVLASDGAFDRFGAGDVRGFRNFLKRTGPDPERIKNGILSAPDGPLGADDCSFIIFRRPL